MCSTRSTLSLKSSATAKSRLEALALTKGWRLEWRSDPWPSISPKANITSLIVSDQRGVDFSRGSIAYFDGDKAKATENLASLMIGE